MSISSKKTKKQNIDENSMDVYNDDIIIEESEVVEVKLKKLKTKLNECQKENKENLLGWQRSRADFVNAKKDNANKIKDSSDYAKSELLEELLPVVDSFEMAFSNKEAWDKVDKNWRTGVEYIYSQFLSVLENNGLKQINPKGKEFDPNFHTSVEIFDTDKKKENNIVVDVIQKGYEQNGKVIRPAKVIVAQYKE